MVPTAPGIGRILIAREAPQTCAYLYDENGARALGFSSLDCGEPVAVAGPAAIFSSEVSARKNQYWIDYTYEKRNE